MAVEISRQHVGKRVLVTHAPCYFEDYPEEAMVLEISAGGRVRLQWPSGAIGWYPADEHRVLEILQEKVAP